jgi:hypothetical protein
LDLAFKEPIRSILHIGGYGPNLSAQAEATRDRILGTALEPLQGYGQSAD